MDSTFPIAEACSLQLLALAFVVSASSVVRRKSSLFPMSSGQRCWLRAYCFVHAKNANQCREGKVEEEFQIFFCISRM